MGKEKKEKKKKQERGDEEEAGNDEEKKRKKEKREKKERKKEKKEKSLDDKEGENEQISKTEKKVKQHTPIEIHNEVGEESGSQDVESKGPKTDKGHLTSSSDKKPMSFQNENHRFDLPQLPNVNKFSDMLHQFNDGSHERMVLVENNTMKDFQTKFSNFQQSVNSKLFPKRQLVLNQMQIVQSKMQEIHAIKISIEEETRIFFNRILARLNNQENEKMTCLQSEWKKLQNHFDDIQNLIAVLSSNCIDIHSLLLHNPPSNTLPSQNTVTIPESSYHFIHSFILNYQDYMNDCEYLSQKLHSVSLDSINSYDFNREVRTLLQSERGYEELRRILQTKNNIIQNLKDERDCLIRQKDQEVQQISKLYLQAKEELFQWMKLCGNKLHQMQSNIKMKKAQE